MKTLYIDTTSNQDITVAITIDEKTDTMTKSMERQKAQVLLPMIEELLKKYTLTLKDIDTIEVNRGPGSFTGTRVGVSIANALSFALGIPVNSINVQTENTIIEPMY